MAAKSIEVSGRFLIYDNGSLAINLKVPETEKDLLLDRGIKYLPHSTDDRNRRTMNALVTYELRSDGSVTLGIDVVSAFILEERMFASYTPWHK